MIEAEVQSGFGGKRADAALRPSVPARVRALLRGFSDSVLPPLCLGCQTRLLDHDALCPQCWRGIAFIRAPL